MKRSNNAHLIVGVGPPFNHPDRPIINVMDHGTDLDILALTEALGICPSFWRIQCYTKIQTFSQLCLLLCTSF